METRVDQVAEKHKSGYNCAQAVACAFCDLVGIDEETMFRMTEACVIAGAKNSTVEMGGSGSKGATYKISKEIVRRFKEESSSVICKELKGVETGTPAKACPDCVKDAARILEEVVFGE